MKVKCTNKKILIIKILTILYVGFLGYSYGVGRYDVTIQGVVYMAGGFILIASLKYATRIKG